MRTAMRRTRLAPPKRRPLRSTSTWPGSAPSRRVASASRKAAVSDASARSDAASASMSGASATPERYRRAARAPLSAAHEPADSGHQLGGLLVALALGCAEHAVRGVVVEHPEGDLVQRGLDRADLGENVDAVAILFDHPRHAADLALDAPQTPLELRLGGRVAARDGLGGGGDGLGRAHGGQVTPSGYGRPGAATARWGVLHRARADASTGGARSLGKDPVAIEEDRDEEDDLLDGHLAGRLHRRPRRRDRLVVPRRRAAPVPQRAGAGDRRVPLWAPPLRGDEGLGRRRPAPGRARGRG